MRSIRKGCRKIRRGKNLVEEVLAPLLVAVADESHQLPRSVQRKRTRTPLELQSGFFRSAVTLAIVALVAARYQILP